MSFTAGENYHGFKLIARETVAEVKSLALFFRHEATGAEVLVMESDDDNKVFSITFRTLPENDTGVAHILEHSVLCGSRRYPVKEPFMELMKGSLKTFLNAMTFSDKTMYPVASRNQKDLYNLMSVYLDAVFFPRLTREIFMQEGWHHELEDAEREIAYKGVVFNEMKGVFSDPESLIERHLSHALFPDTVYGYESGGDPARIPELTYEDFAAFHRRYYHPSNSRIFFYGDGNTLEYLRYLDDHYLRAFSRQAVNGAIVLQPAFAQPKREEMTYPVSADEGLQKKTFVLVGLVLGLATDEEHCLGFDILSYLLLGTPASPLRKALIDSGLGSEVVGGGFDDQRAQTVFAVGLKGTEKEHEQKIIGLIFATLRGLAEKGIEENMLLAALNTVEFKLRESNFGGFPKGIVYNIQALNSWLYGADPFMHLKYERLLAKIKEQSRAGYFERLIRKYLLDNNHRCVVVATPSPDYAEALEAQEKERLAALKTRLSAGELQKMAAETRELQELQARPDSPEALATLPRLEIKDINQQTEKFPQEIKRPASPQILFHDLFTNGIGYVQAGFNTRSVPQDRIQYLSLLGKLILEMGTRKRGYVEMAQQIGIHTGGIRVNHYSSQALGNGKDVISYLFFNGKAVLDKLDRLFDFYGELLGEYNFDNPKRLLEILRSAKADMEASIIPSGNQYVLARLQSYHSRLGQYDETTGGLTYFRFLEQMLAEAERNPEAVAARFGETARHVFARDNMLFNITAEGKDYARFGPLMDNLARTFPETAGAPVRLRFDAPVASNEAFQTASAIQYVGKGANFYALGFKYSGQFEVVKAILNTAYLWDRVRVQGGAYGCSASFDFYSGDFGIVSYRDPNLRETLEAYDQIAGFLEQLDLSEDELTKFLIGCVGRLDPPLTADRKGAVAMVEHLTGLTYEMRCRKREEILSTTLGDLRGFAQIFRQLRERGSVCVLGNEEKIRQQGDAFKKICKIFN